MKAPPPRDLWDLTPEEALAERIVDEAMAGVDVPADLAPFYRVQLICELLTTDDGLELLRRLLDRRKQLH